MEEKDWGTRDARGEWQPTELPKPSPLFSVPWRPWKVLKYLFAPEGLLWPWSLFFAALAVASWLWFTPPLAEMATFKVWWIAELYARNVVIVTLVAGAMHLRLYTAKGQGTRFKYTNKWLARNDSSFLFRSQLWDNVFWSLVSGCLTWTAWEAVTMWLYATGRIPMVDFRAHPVYGVLIMISVIFLRQLHFYWVHRLIHWKPLYGISHYLHHKNINIGPWSGLSMHPLEHLLYFSGVLFHWIIPSPPMAAVFHLLHAGATPALGHTGFHKFTSNRTEKGLMADNYFHYLHHRFFTVNFGTDVVPLDKWFGSFHDGSPEAHAAMMARRRKARSAMTDEETVKKG